MSDVDLYTFPRNEAQALTILYLENQDLKGKTIEEITAIYLETVKKCSEAFKELGKKAH